MSDKHSDVREPRHLQASGGVLIQPTRGWGGVRFRELWEHRELLYFLVWRNIRVRYKQTVLGAAWAILQPLLMMVVFTVFFGRLGKIPSDGLPYPLFSFAALVPWNFFSNALTQSTSSVVDSANLVRKIYFPRLLVPVAAVISGLVDFGLAFFVLIGFLFAYGIPLRVTFLCLPAFVFLALVAALGVGLWLSAMNVQFRDVKHLVPFLTQLWLFATPVAYPSSLLPGPWRTLYGINPMVGVVEGFRWALLDVQTLPGRMLILSALVAVGLLVSGTYYFRRMERGFADVV